MAEDKPQVEIIPLSDLTPDKRNPNKGTPRGRKMIEDSLKRLGAGRSILLDKNNRAISGNKTLESAIAQGHKKIMIVESDGDTLVAVRRTDLDLDEKKARELSVVDNRASEIDLSWDPEILKSTDVALEELFDDTELEALIGDGKGPRAPEKIDLQPPPKMLWILLGVPFNRFDKVQEHLAALEKVSEISVQSARDE